MAGELSTAKVGRWRSKIEWRLRREEIAEKSVASTEDEKENLSRNAGSNAQPSSSSFSHLVIYSSHLVIYEEKLAEWKKCNPALKSVPNKVIEKLKTEVAATGSSGEESLLLTGIYLSSMT